MEIIDNRLYRPQEIVKNGFILNSMNKPDYNYVLKLIGDGTLKAINKGLKNKKVVAYMVSGKEIKRYKREEEGLVI